MTTPKELIERVDKLIKENKIEFIGCKPEIENYGVHKTKGEWVVLNKQKYFLNKGKVVSEQLKTPQR